MSITKLTCKVCNVKKGITPDRLVKLVAKFGSEKELLDKYICRSCRKTNNVRSDGKKLPEKREYIKKTWDGVLPDSLQNWRPKDRSTLGTIAYDTVREVCWRPDIWSKNDRACNSCPFLLNRLCRCKTIIVRKGKKEIRLDCDKLDEVNVDEYK